MFVMSATALQERLVASGGQLAGYSGAETAAVFSDAASEFRALRESCGVYDLGWRAKIILTGEDRVRWLNGMVTNNIKDLATGFGNYNFALNAQGRIQGDLYAYQRPDDILIDTERAQLAKLLEMFDHFIIMDDVEVFDAGDRLTAIGVQGPQAGDILRKAGVELPAVEPMQFKEIEWQGIALTVTRMADSHANTYELWLAPENAGKLWDALLAAGAVPVGTLALEIFRTVLGVPKIGTDIRERDLPQETGQVQALNFTKGCYLGQEIVERIRSRGNVHRTFGGFLLHGSEPERGVKLTAEGKEVGELTTVNRIPRSAGKAALVALGYIRREALDRKATIEYQGGTAEPAGLPFNID
jgi:folate-binding protein YgfZ